MPTAPRSSTKVPSAAIRLTIFQGVKIAAATTALRHSRGLLERLSEAAVHSGRLIPEIGIWRAAQLILKRYGEQALEESGDRAEELALACLSKPGQAAARLP